MQNIVDSVKNEKSHDYSFTIDFPFFVSSQFFNFAYTSSVMWSRVYEIGPHLEVNSMIETSDGGYTIAGGFDTPADFWLVKIDELGNIQWNRTYGGEKKDVAYSLVETSDGGYALAGFTESFGRGEEDFWLVKTDSDGNMQWNRTYGGPEPEVAYSLIETSDGGYASVLGNCLIKTDAQRIMEWKVGYETNRHLWKNGND